MAQVQQEVAATGREGSNRTHVVSTGRTADAVADSDRCVLLRTLSTFLNSTFLPVLLFAWRPPLPRGSSGYRHPETSTGLFFFLELRSHVVVGHLRSGATGGGTVPVLGRQIARRRENSPWRRSWRPPQRFRVQRRHGPRRWPSFSTTKCHQEKSFELYVRICAKCVLEARAHQFGRQWACFEGSILASKSSVVHDFQREAKFATS